MYGALAREGHQGKFGSKFLDQGRLEGSCRRMGATTIAGDKQGHIHLPLGACRVLLAVVECRLGSNVSLSGSRYPRERGTCYIP
jgi:hypothetical protein